MMSSSFLFLKVKGSGDSQTHWLVGHSRVLYTVHVILRSTLGFHENDCTLLLSCKSAVCNDHLSIWSVRTKSRCAVARCRGLKGGNSYLTCTAERQQLTERCHFRCKRSAPDRKHTVAGQGQGVRKTCGWDDRCPQVGAPASRQHSGDD